MYKTVIMKRFLKYIFVMFICAFLHEYAFAVTCPTSTQYDPNPSVHNISNGQTEYRFFPLCTTAEHLSRCSYCGSYGSSGGYFDACKCNAGYYAVRDGSMTCKCEPCSSGYYKSSQDSSFLYWGSCTRYYCGKGRRVTTNTAMTYKYCPPCSPGQYNDSDYNYNAYCSNCPSAWTTQSYGSTSASDCKVQRKACPAGKYGDGVNCNPCPEFGTPGVTWSDTSISSDGITYQNLHKGSCRIPTGEYTIESGTFELGNNCTL